MGKAVRQIPTPQEILGDEPKKKIPTPQEFLGEDHPLVKKKQISGGGVTSSSMDGQTGLRPIETTEEQRQQAAQMYEENKAREIDPFLKVSGGDKKLIAEAEKLQRAVRNKRETQAAQVALQEGKDLEDMAAHYRAQLDPSFREQFENLRSTGQFHSEPFSDIVQGKPGREIKARASDIFGKSTRGNNLANFILNPNVQQLAKENPEFNIQLKQEAANLLQNFPEFGEKYLGGIISQKMEDIGINNGIVNVVSKKELDQAVSKLKEEGQLTPQEEKFIAERIRPKMGLGNFWRSITGQPAVKTTGLVENALEGAIGGVQDLGKGIAEIKGINSARLSDKGLLSSDIEREHIKMSVKPVGIWHDIATLGGQAFGQSWAIGGAAKGIQGLKLIKSPAGALAFSGGVSAYGRYSPEARQKFPDSKLKQIGYTTLMSGVQIGTEGFFNDMKVVNGLMKEIKSPIQKVIKDFTQKNIDAAAAKAAVNNSIKSAIEKLPQAAKLFGKAVGENTLEEVAAEIGGQASAGVFEGKPVNEWFDGDQIAETAKQGLLGSIFIGGLATRADLKKSQGLTAKQIYLMARDPEGWAEKIRESATDPADANDVKDKLENLDYAANLLKELDGNTKMSEKQKAKYVLLSLQSKTNAQTQPTATDEVLRGQQQRNITDSQRDFNTAKEELLTGKDDGTFEGDKSDEANADEKKLFEQIFEKATPVTKMTIHAARKEGNILAGLEYMKDKFAENPIKFREDFGDEITDKVLAQTPTETIMEKLDYLLETNADDPAVGVLDKILSDREQPVSTTKDDGNYDELIRQVEDAMAKGAPLNESILYVSEKAQKEGKSINEEEFFKAAYDSFREKNKSFSEEKTTSTGEIKNIIDKSETGKPLSFEGYRVSESEDINPDTGAFFSDSGTVDILMERAKHNAPGYAGRFKGEKRKHSVSLNNPLKIKNKQTFLQGIIDKGDEQSSAQAKKALDSLKEYGFFAHSEVDKIITKEAKKLGHDGIINEDESEIVAFDKGSISGEDKKSGELYFEQIEEKVTDKYTSNDFSVKKDGKRIGEVMTLNHEAYKDKGTKIVNIYIDEEQRGKGIGKEIYRKINEESIKKTGFPAWSSKGTRNDNSNRVWAALEKSGEAEINAEGDYSFKMPEKKSTDEGQPPISEPPKGKPTIHAEQPPFTLIKRELARVRENMGLESYEGDTVTDVEAMTKAARTTSEWKEKGVYEKEINKIIDDGMTGKVSDEGQNLLAQYIADLNVTAKSITDRNSPEYDNVMAKLKKATDAGDAIRSEFGRGLGRNRLKMRGEVAESVQDVELDMMADYGVDKLTPDQKAEADKRFNDLNAAMQKEQELRAKAEEEVVRLREELEIEKAKAEIREAKKSGQKKDFNKERKEILQSMKDKWKQAGKDTLSSDLPFRKQFAAIAPDVGKLIRSYIEQGITKLEEIRAALKKDILEAEIEVTDEEVRALIAGRYNEKKETRNELANKVRVLREEEKLLLQLEALERGEAPTDEKKKIAKNQRLKSIRDQIEELQKKNKLGKYSDQEKFERTVKQQIENNRKKVKEYEDKIKKGDFADKEPEVGVLQNKALQENNKTLYEEYLKSAVQKQDAMVEYEKKRLNDKIKNYSKLDWAGHGLSTVLATSKGTVAMFDQSGVLVQMLTATLSHPVIAAKNLPNAIVDLFYAKKFKERMAKLKGSPLYKLIEDSDLALYDPDRIDDNFRNELMGGRKNLLSRDITIPKSVPLLGGKKVSAGKALERSTANLFNNMRVTLFENGVTKLYSQGKTWESHPEEFKGLARAINEWTGHGKTIPLGKAAPIVNSIIWSPKMMASTYNVLGLGDLVRPVQTAKEIGKAMGIKGIKDDPEKVKGFYSSLTPTQRAFMRKEIGRALTTVAVIMLANRLKRAIDGEDDDPQEYLNPLSPGFGSIRVGDKDINLLGRYGGAVKGLSQSILGKRYLSGEINELGDEYGEKTSLDVLWGSQMRGKMTPFAGVAHDLILNNQKHYYTREKMTGVSILKSLTIPLSFQEIAADFKKDGVLVGLLETLFKIYGGNIRDKSEFEKKGKPTRPERPDREDRPERPN